jgi:hypothetical protein
LDSICYGASALIASLFFRLAGGIFTGVFALYLVSFSYVIYKGVLSSSKMLDSLLQTAAKEILTAHQDLNIVIKGQAYTGDAYSRD